MKNIKIIILGVVMWLYKKMCEVNVSLFDNVYKQDKESLYFVYISFCFIDFRIFKFIVVSFFSQPTISLYIPLSPNFSSLPSLFIFFPIKFIFTLKINYSLFFSMI